SNRAVRSIEISSSGYSMTNDGLEDDEKPTVIIEPYGIMSAEMNAGLEPGKPIVITAAVFDDMKEEGRQTSLELMRKIRLRQRAILKARKTETEKSSKP
ncbi:MAG: hypothetical protein ACREBC_27270, partial [Pyrinomonadaceae bacterium]